MKIKKIPSVIFLALLIFAGSMFGQTTPQPTPTVAGQQQAAMSFADSLRDFTSEAIVARQLFIDQVEKPMSGWIYTLGQLLALIMFSWAIAQGVTQGGFMPGDLQRIGLRCAIGFLLLLFAGDIDEDGIRGDLINYPASVGYYYAYGVAKNGQIEGSYLNKYTTDQEKKFNDQYQKFVENKFMVKVNGSDIPVTYPTTQDVNLLAALYTGKPMNQDEIDKAKSREWQMSMLYGAFNFARGLLSFADFFLFFISGFAVLVLRLALPLMIGMFFHKDYGQKITTGFFWTAFVWTIIFPGMCQFIRLCAYSAGNVALGLGGHNPYYTWDATTSKIVANGNPEVIIVIGIAYMIVSALCLFAAFFLSMYLSQGKILEGIISTTSAWYTAATSIGMGVVTGAMASKLNMQAEQTSAQGAQDAAMAEAGFAKQSSEMSAKASNEASKALADSSSEASKTQAGASKAAEDLMTESQYKSSELGAFSGLVTGLANAKTEGYQSRANALMNFKQEWMNLDSKEKQDHLGNALDFAVKNNDAYAREIQQAIKDYPEAKELIGKQVDNFLNGIPVVGSALKTIGLSGDAFNSWLGGATGKTVIGQMLGSANGGNGIPTGVVLSTLNTSGGFQGIFSDDNVSKVMQQDMKNADNNVNFSPQNPSNIAQNATSQAPHAMTATQKANYAKMSSLMKSDPQFMPTLKRMCAKNGWNPDDLLNTFALETAGTWNPAIVGGAGNKKKGIDHDFVGLIQFGTAARNQVGLPDDVQAASNYLKTIPASQQLGYVEKYLRGAEKAAGTKLNDFGAVYAAVGGGSGNYQKSLRNGGIIFSATSTDPKNRAGYNANAKSWDTNKDGVITQADFGKAAQDKLGAGRFFSIMDSATIPDAKVLSQQYARQYERDFALRQNQMNYQGKDGITTQVYGEQRDIAQTKLTDSNQIANNVETMRSKIARQQYGYAVQGAQVVRSGAHQTTNIRFQGANNAADITKRGQYKAADINLNAAIKSANMAFDGRKLATQIQYDSAIKSSSLRALGSIWQNLGSSAGHHISEASEKFSRL